MSGTTEQGISTGPQNNGSYKTPDEKNIFYKTLVDPKKNLLAPLHMELGLMKQDLPKSGESFKQL